MATVAVLSIAVDVLLAARRLGFPTSVPPFPRENRQQ